MNRKITYLHQYFTIPSVAGGTRSWEFCTRLLKDNWQVTMICSDSQIEEVTEKQIDKLLGKTSGSFGLIVIRQPYSNKMNYLQRIFVFIKFALSSSVKLLLEKKVSLVYATSTPLTIVIPALLRKCLLGTPYVFEVRDLWPEMPIVVGALRSPILIKLARWLEYLAYTNAEHIVALSPGMQQGVIERNIPPEKVTVIPNSCDNAIFNVSEEVGQEFLAKHPELSGGPLIVYSGTLGYLNDVSYLAHLACHMRELMPEAKFLVVGAGALEEDLKETSLKLGILNKNFWIWTPIPKAEMPALLSACTVATSLFRPIPEMGKNSANKFFDALAAGRPVVINYRGWQKELLEETGAGISLPGHDPKAGALQLFKFLNDPQKIVIARQAARKLAIQRFNRDFLYEKLAGILTAVSEKYIY